MRGNGEISIRHPMNMRRLMTPRPPRTADGKVPVPLVGRTYIYEYLQRGHCHPVPLFAMFFQSHFCDSRKSSESPKSVIAGLTFSCNQKRFATAIRTSVFKNRFDVQGYKYPTLQFVDGGGGA